MIINSHSLRLKKLFHLIEMEFTGKPDQLSILLGVSQRALARYLDILRELGADIRYSRSMETYYFGSPTRIEIENERDREKYCLKEGIKLELNNLLKNYYNQINTNTFNEKIPSY